MENNTKGAFLKFRIDPAIKILFNQLFNQSSYKSINEFIESLINPKKLIIKNTNDKNLLINKQRFTIRVTAIEKAHILDIFQKSSEKRIGTFLLRCVQKAPIHIEHVTRLDDKVSIELRKIGTNINQIAHRANQEGKIDQEMLSILTQIKTKLIMLTKIS